MKALLATLALTISAALLTGCGTPALEAPAPQQTITGTPTPIEEDDPGWDCKTMGNKVCGGDTIDAWASWDKDPIHATRPDLKADGPRVSYMGRFTGTNVKREFVVVESATKPGTFYSFLIEKPEVKP